MKVNNPYLKVHFEIESHKATDILLPVDLLEHSAIPCHSIVLDNPNTQVSEMTICNFILETSIEILPHANNVLQISPSMVLTHGAFFDSTLRVYAFKGVTRYYLHRGFAKRLDEALLQFCRICPNLHTLVAFCI